MESDSSPESILDRYRDQYIPNKVLQTFNQKVVDDYKCYDNRPEFKFKKYNDYESIVSYLFEIRRKYPGIVKIIEIGRTHENRCLLVVRVAEPRSHQFDRIFVEGGIHANEWASPATVLFVINKFLTEWQSMPSYMKLKRWYFLPLTNPDGYVFSKLKNTNRDWRKNRRPIDLTTVGVDLNRNFSLGWILNENKDQNSTYYKGPGPFSEKETKAIRDFLEPQRKYLKAYIAFHTFGQQVRYLWSYSTPIKHLERVKEVAHNVIENINETLNIEYTKDEQIPDLYGLSRDWARKELNVPYAFTIRLRDTGKQGYGLSPKEIPKCADDAYAVLSAIGKEVQKDGDRFDENKPPNNDKYHFLLYRTSYIYKVPSRKPIIK